MEIDAEKERELEVLIKGAGTRLLQYWPGGDPAATGANLGIAQKKDGSFVTRADFESNELLIAGLNNLFPGDGIYSEELAHEEKLRTMPVVWIIDPLDGTKSFIEGRDDFSILMGRCVGDRIDYGLMYFPVRGHFVVGKRGHGATQNGLPMQVSPSKQFRPKSIYLRHMDLVPVPEHYDQWMDSGMAFLSLCRGELDGIIMRLLHHQEWDLAAPSLMIEESGGMVTDEFGKRLSFKRGPVTYKYLVASNGILHEKLLKIIPR